MKIVYEIHEFVIDTEVFGPRFWAKTKRMPNGCLEWQGAMNKSRGYGLVVIDQKSFLAHRVAYALHHGRAPVLLVLHSCDNRICVDPTHLREGTQKENLQDARERGRLHSMSDVNAAKTHCYKGHPFDKENTIHYLNPTGGQERRCKECRQRGVG